MAVRRSKCNGAGGGGLSAIVEGLSRVGLEAGSLSSWLESWLSLGLIVWVYSHLGFWA